MKESALKPTARRAALFGAIMSIAPVGTQIWVTVIFEFSSLQHELGGYMPENMLRFYEWVDRWLVSNAYYDQHIAIFAFCVLIGISALALFMGGYFRCINLGNIIQLKDALGTRRGLARVVSKSAAVIIVTFAFITVFDYVISQTVIAFDAGFINKAYGELYRRYGQIYGEILFLLVTLPVMASAAFLGGVSSYLIVHSDSLRKFYHGLKPVAAGIAMLVLSFASELVIEAALTVPAPDFADAADFMYLQDFYEIAYVSDEPDVYGPITFSLASQANERAALEYFNSDARDNRYDYELYSFLTGMRTLDMDTDGSFATYRMIYRQDWGELYFALQNINRLAANPERLKLLDEITENGLYIGGGAALEVSKAYAKYGRMDKSRVWYDKWLMTTLDSSWRPDKKFSNFPSNQPPLSTGSVSGRVTLDSKPLANAPVAIVPYKWRPYDIRVNEKTVKEPETCTKCNLYHLGRWHNHIRDIDINMSDLERMASGMRTDDDGRFRFDGLRDDEYFFYVRLDILPDSDYRVDTSPGIVTISREAPSVDIGTIGLVKVKQRSAEEIGNARRAAWEERAKAAYEVMNEGREVRTSKKCNSVKRGKKIKQIS